MLTPRKWGRKGWREGKRWREVGGGTKEENGKKNGGARKGGWGRKDGGERKDGEGMERERERRDDRRYIHFGEVWRWKRKKNLFVVREAQK